MALKRKITKDEFDKLSELLQAEYKEKDGEYVLDIDGDEDTGALKRAKDREAQKRRDAEKRAKELEDELEDLKGDDARKNGDIKTLEKSWQKKLDDQKAEGEARVKTLESNLKREMIEGKADAIARAISTVPSLMSKEIKSRLKVEFDGDDAVLRVLDKDGKVSAATIDDLQKEIVANPEFSSIIIASKASGSGASNDGKNSGGATTTDKEPVNKATLSPKDLAASITAKKEAEQ